MLTRQGHGKGDLSLLRIHLASAASLAALLAATSYARAESAVENIELAYAAADEIVVVGRVLYSDQVNALKTPTPIIDVPQSLSIVTADEINQRGFTSIGDIINYTPGVNTSQGEGHRDAIVFRGVRSTADFFIDGVRDDVQYYRPLYNLEQVEILRGPNALLFGRGGTGGILNRVAKKGVIGENFNGFRASADTFGAFGFEIDSNFSASDNAAFRINAMYENLNNHRDFYDGDRFSVNPTAHVELSPATTLDVSYEYLNHERFIDRGIPTGSDGRPVEDFKDIVFGDPEENFHELEAHLVRAILQHRLNDNLKARFSAFYGDYDKLYVNLYASGYDQAATPDIVTLDGYIDTTQRRNLSLTGDLIGEFATGRLNHTIVTGVEYIDTVNNNDRFNPFWDVLGADRAADINLNGTSSIRTDIANFDITRPLNIRGGVGVLADGRTATNIYGDLTVPNAEFANPDIINDDTEADITVFSAYIQDQIEITDWLDVVAGVRFDRFKISVTDLVDPMNPVFRERTDEEISPRFGVILKPQENISIYGSYSESFLPRSGEQFASINDTTRALDPNEFTNLEAGVKWDINEGLSLTAAVFEIEQSSPQPEDNDPATLDIIDSKIQGFEVQLQGHLMERWYVSAGYSYLDGNQVNADGSEGNRVRELPENMFSIWNSFQATDKLGLGIGLTYQDESFINNGNTAILPSYVRLDAAAYYDVSDNLRLQVNIENLTDELYFPNAHSTHQATVAAPINARFSISGRL